MINPQALDPAADKYLFEEYAAFDEHAPPPATLAVPFRQLDFTEPASDQRLLEIFREEAIDSVVHAAFFTNPQRDRTYAHELEKKAACSMRNCVGDSCCNSSAVTWTRSGTPGWRYSRSAVRARATLRLTS